MESANAFGKNLTKLRKAKGLTRKALAEKLSIHENTLTGYELLGREPSYDTLIKIADFFGVTVDELIRKQLFRFMGSTTRLIVIDGKDRKDVEFSEADKAGLRIIADSLAFVQQLKEKGLQAEKSGQSVDVPFHLKISDSKFSLNDLINEVNQHTDTDKIEIEVQEENKNQS